MYKDNSLQFDVGDRVRYVSTENMDGNKELTDGCVGTVVAISSGTVGVEWDHNMRAGHSLGGRCREGHGYWVR